MGLDFPPIHPVFKKNQTINVNKKEHTETDFLFALTAVDLCWVLPGRTDVRSSSVCLEEYCMFACSDG